MSLQAVSWALYADHRADLDPTARLVLVVLADHANTDGIAWPGRDRVARAVGASVDTIDRRLTALADAGLLTRVDPDDPALPAGWHELRPDRRPVAYRLAFTGPQAAAPSPTERGRTPAAPSSPRGRNTPPTGPQHAGHGAATVRHEPREPRELPRAHARDAREDPRAAPPTFDSRPDSTRPHPRCGRIHSLEEPCPRVQPPDVATRGAALARAALAARSEAS